MNAVRTRASFSAYPLAWLALALALGILAARGDVVSLRAWLGCGLVGSGAAVWCVWRRLGPATALVLCAFVCAGGGLATCAQRAAGADGLRRWLDDGRIVAGGPVELTGVLTAAPEVAPDGLQLALRVERIRYQGVEAVVAGAVQLFAPLANDAARGRYELLELRRGARVRVLTQLERDAQFRNPGANSLGELLTRRGFDATGLVKSPLLFERLDDERVLLPLVWLDVLRETLRAQLARLYAPEAAGVLQAALLGNRLALGHDTAERFRAGGTFHVLVISGLHISFIGWLAYGGLRLVTRRRAWRFAATLVLLWAYAVAVGAEVSVVRAALMFTVLALAPLLGRPAAGLNALGGAALALLGWRPGDLFDPSFQLTFLAVLGIVALAWPVLQQLQAIGAWRPTRATPYPPAAPGWLRAFAETLYWRERAGQQAAARTVYSYRLFKCGAAARLERCRVQWLGRYVCAAVVVSASVQLLLLPLLVVYFHRLAPAALLLNIFVGVLLAAAGLTALVALALSYVSLQLAQPLVWLGTRLVWLMTHSVDPFARLPVASLRLPAYHDRAALVYLLYYVPLVVLLVALARWRPLMLPPAAPLPGVSLPAAPLPVAPLPVAPPPAGAAWPQVARGHTVAAGLLLVALLWIIGAHPFSAAAPDGRLRVDFLDVGQGDAALVTAPDGTTLLVDGGGRPGFNWTARTERQRADRAGATAAGPAEAEAEAEVAPFTRDTRGIGDAVVSEYLWWRGLARVDYVLATHAHADHTDGLNDVTRNFAVRAAFVARAPVATPEYARLAATWQEAGVPVYRLGRGDVLRLGALTVEVLWPPASADPAATSGNDDSLVLRLRYADRVVLLTGDIEAHAEAALVGARDDLRCDVVKTAHHGSKTSSTAAFVAATRPALAVISVGRTSPFGHPDAGVVERWRAQGATVLLTGHSGTVSVSTDGRDLRVTTYVPD